MANRLGLEISKLRTKKGMSQKELAKALGVTNTVISAYEKGKRNPSPKHLEVLSIILDVDIDLLIEYQSDNSTEINNGNHELTEEMRSTLEYLKTQIDVLNAEKSRLLDVIDRLTLNFPLGSSLILSEEKTSEATSLKLVA